MDRLEISRHIGRVKSIDIEAETNRQHIKKEEEQRQLIGIVYMGIVYTVCNCLHAFLYVYISVCEVPNTSVLVQMGDGLESERMCVGKRERECVWVRERENE